MNNKQEQSVDQKTSSNNFQYAGFGRRLLAYFADFLILFLIGIVVQYALGFNPFVYFQDAKSLEQYQSMIKTSTSTFSSIISLAVALIYYLIFYVNYDGATPGKKLMAIKVIRDDGSKVTYPVVLVRFLSSFVSGFLLGIGYLMTIWDKKKQSLHDKIARTLVVKTDAKPKTFLAILIMLISIVTFSGFMGLIMFKAFLLSYQQIQKDTAGFAGRSIKQYKATMKPEAKIHYEKSMQLFKDIAKEQDNPDKVTKLNDENIVELNKAIEIDPKNPELWYQLGNAYTWISSTGTLEDGLNANKKAEEFDPNNVVYINGVGDMLVRLNKYEEAILQFQKTLRITDKSGFAHLSIARAYAKLGIKDSAKEHYQKAIDVFTSNNSEGSFDVYILQARKGLAEVSE